MCDAKLREQLTSITDFINLPENNTISFNEIIFLVPNKITKSLQKDY